MKLKQQARVLKRKALTSFITAAEAFNSPRDDGRVTKVLLHPAGRSGVAGGPGRSGHRHHVLELQVTARPSARLWCNGMRANGERTCRVMITSSGGRAGR